METKNILLNKLDEIFNKISSNNIEDLLNFISFLVMLLNNKEEDPEILNKINNILNIIYEKNNYKNKLFKIEDFSDFSNSMQKLISYRLYNDLSNFYSYIEDNE